MTGTHAIYRAQRGLTPAVREVLEAGQYAVLGTVNPDGSAHVAPVMYRFEDGCLLMETSRATRKARNVAERHRATVLVQDPRADGTAWASGAGRAELLGGEDARVLGRRIRSRYLTEAGERDVGAVMEIYDDAVIVVRPDIWLSWDMTAFNETLAGHGVSMDDAESWFVAGPQSAAT